MYYFRCVLNLIKMCKSDKFKFIDNISWFLKKYCPLMSEEVVKFVACQFALESNFGRSRLATHFHNFCGMKIPSLRPTLNCRVASSGFAQFTDLDCCVIDYVYWLAYNRFNSYDLFYIDNFKAKLKAKNYCPDSDYIDKITLLFNSLKS